MTIADVTEHLGVSWWMVKDIEQRHLQKHYARPRLKQLRRIAIDRWNVAQLATQLDGDGFEIVAFGQGYPSMSAPTKKLEEVVLSRKLAHAGHTVLRWMAGNVSIDTDAADNWKPSKKKSVERIGGVVALIMALDRATCAATTSRGGFMLL